MLHSQQNRGANLRQSGYPFPVYSLFTWTNSNDRLIRPLSYGFKRGLAFRAAQALALNLLHEVSCHRQLSSPWLVHPGGAQRDHSWLLAQVLVRLLGPVEAQSVVGLRKEESVEGGPQKLKSASARRSRRFVYEEKFSGRRLSWVFVDDVITTGSTAQAAYEALGEPESFEVWALICRPKLAGKPSFW